MEARTSITHPLQIASLTTPGGGRIGMTLCPGKKDPVALTGAWDRDLDTDLQAIRDWGATVLISLMEEYEFGLLHVQALGERARAFDLTWYHLPIQDVSIPNEQFEAQWEAAGPEIRRRLDAGDSVLLHCRGGLGRTGTIAARLLIELGEDAQQALHRVRVARVGTVETEEQEEYVLSLGQSSSATGGEDELGEDSP